MTKESKRKTADRLRSRKKKNEENREWEERKKNI